MQLKESVNVATKNEYFHPCWVDRKKTKKKKVSTEKKRTFIFASRVSNHKGINLVIDAVEELINSSISNFKVDIFGDGDIASLMSNIQTRNLQGHINYVGNLNKADLLSRYRNYDSLLFPTWEIEVFGFVVVEAMSSGCIPILTKGIVLIGNIDKTDRVNSGLTPDPVGGDPVYVGDNGSIATDGEIVIGKFLSSPDQDGFALILLNVI
jgi:glycosyltransferase involved in cell wall biosynthesis